jgi:putative endonuclease
MKTNGGDNRKKTGGEGEGLAKAFLEQKGYRCLHQNWTKGRGDIDLIMQQNETLVFVEVKTRSSLVPFEDMAPGKKQIEHLFELAERYLELNPPQAEVRFDLVFVTKGLFRTEIVHLEHGLSGA